MTTPKLSPRSARAQTERTICSVISVKLVFFASTSSLMMQTFGCVRSAHSSATCEAERPMTLTKCQYLRAEQASRSMLPMRSAYVFVAVSKPKDISTLSFFRSPSIVFGQPMTCTPVFSRTKYSASIAAFVFESSPPIITIADIPRFAQTSAAILNCSSVSSFVLPEPMMSKPPVFL